MATLITLAQHYNYVVTIFLMMAGLYIVIARGNMVKKLIGLSIFQTSVYLLYIAPGKIIGGTAPIIDPAFSVYSNPLPHVLILTAIVVGVATLALGLALVVRINEAYGTIEEEEIFERDRARMNAVWPHLPGLAGRHSACRRAARSLSATRRPGIRARAGGELDACRSSPARCCGRCCTRVRSPMPSAAGRRRGASSIASTVLNGFVLMLVSAIGAVIMPFARRSRRVRGRRSGGRPGSIACTCSAWPAARHHDHRRRVQRLRLSRNIVALDLCADRARTATGARCWPHSST